MEHCQCSYESISCSKFKKPLDADVESNRECERFVLKEVLWQSDKSMHKELTTGRPRVKTTKAVKNHNNGGEHLDIDVD